MISRLLLLLALFAPAAFAALPANELWREALTTQVVGFGKNTTGGKGGTLCQVVTLADSGAGSLRACAESTGPAWIVFAVSGTIPLQTEIQMASNKTIDGRGQAITLTGKGLRFGTRGGQGAPTVNVIVHNIKFFDITGNAALMIAAQAQHVWIDHVTISKMVDEGVYIGGAVAGEVAPRDITISWSRWDGLNNVNSADKVLLISDAGLPQDAATTITLHHNWYNKMYARHPLGRHAKVHAFNNFYDEPVIGVDGRTDLQFLSENEILKYNVSGSAPMIKIWAGGYAPDDPRGAKNVKVLNPWLLNGATYQQLNAATIFNPATSYAYVAEVADAALQTKIINGAGYKPFVLPN